MRSARVFFCPHPQPLSHAVGEGCRGAQRGALLRVLPGDEGRRGARWCALLRVPLETRGVGAHGGAPCCAFPLARPAGEGDTGGEGKPNSMRGGQPLSPPCFLVGKGGRHAGLPLRDYTNRKGRVYNCPPPAGSPRFARGTAWGAWVRFPLLAGGTLRRGVIGHTRFCELWLRDWYYRLRNPAESGQGRP